MARNIFTPERNAFAQNSYKDQQATALAGHLAFASDKNFVDGYIVGEVGPDGLEAGLACIAGIAPDAQRAGLNEHVVTRPLSTTIAASILGIVIRNQQMGTNTAGKACYFAQDTCNVVRGTRSGGRVWVQLVDGAQPEVDEAVFVAVSGTNAGKFATAVQGLDGSNPVAGFVAVSTMQFKSAANDGIALVELG